MPVDTMQIGDVGICNFPMLVMISKVLLSFCFIYLFIFGFYNPLMPDGY